jgi:hypothetical protein
MPRLASSAHRSLENVVATLQQGLKGGSELDLRVFGGRLVRELQDRVVWLSPRRSSDKEVSAVKNGRANGKPSEAIRREAVEFLRWWLPEEAKRVYREMILEDPENWSKHPHFSGGIIVKHALRGNGIDERALGIKNLDAIWPELLLAALSQTEGTEGNGGHADGS